MQQTVVKMAERKLRIIFIALVIGAITALVDCANNSTEAETQPLEEFKCRNSSISEFPEDLFVESQRKNGAVILHFILALYCFTLIAIVCNNYFLPSVDCICTDLSLPQDVAGATFMAIATSTPELFINVIGTFITESDLGVGTVVGSATFNTLGVAACLGLSASKVLQLDWWPLTRDCSIYMTAIGVLTVITYDERIEWYEAAVLLLMYILYFIVMYSNRWLMKMAKKIEFKVFGSTTEFNDAEDPLSEVCSTVGPGKFKWYTHGELSIRRKFPETMEKPITEKEPIKKDEERRICPPSEVILGALWSVYTWPITFLLSITIPDCRKNHFRPYYPFTFFMCIIWIGASSYLNAWMMSVIGDTIGVPDSVMGLTVLAAGGCLPEAFSSIIMARKGIGAMGISNSVGANTLDILLCLGLPWFIKCMVLMAATGDPSDGYVQILSKGVTYNCFALLLCVFVLYSAISLFHFQIRKLFGVTSLTLYGVFITFAVLSEMNMFYYVNDPLCG